MPHYLSTKVNGDVKPATNYVLCELSTAVQMY